MIKQYSFRYNMRKEYHVASLEDFALSANRDKYCAVSHFLLNRFLSKLEISLDDEPQPSFLALVSKV